jgi:quercetin dioxygenase-like cupin family protein
MTMGDWIEDPVLKLRMRLDRAGDVLNGEVEIQPGGGIGKHFHPGQEECWVVHEGSVRFGLGWRRLVPRLEEEVVVSAGVRHRLKNIGAVPARLSFTANPALDLEPFLEEAAALNSAGKVTSFGVPTSFGALLDGAAFIDRYKETCVLVFPPPFPPPALQPLVFAPLARLACRRSR